ncbi:MAG: GtrA family protein [Alphaproteobacteria bacterium]|nr:GtrA family protein [Alphaproteobacteria bacterium]
MAVGLAATASDLLTLTFIVEALGLPNTVANVPGLLVGTTVQYLGNKTFAFRDPSRDHLRKGTLFALVETATFTFNAVGFHLVVTHTPVPMIPARLLVSSLIYFTWQFPMWRRVFAHDAPAEP